MSDELLWRNELLTAGYTAQEVRRMRLDGELVAVRPGAYAVGAAPEQAEQRHLLDVRATYACLAPDVVVSHVSAAVLHGLPVWGIALDQVHASRNRGRTGGRRGRRVHLHTAPLDDDEITVVDGIPATTVARTLIDLSRSQQFEAAVVPADAALARGAVDAEQLASALQRCGRWPGLPAARRVVGFVDGCSESVGESRSRVAMARFRLPRPVSQFVITDDRGMSIGRADFGWPEFRTIGEFDGRAKYGRLLRPNQTAGDAVFAEKLREDRIRAQGLAVVRWTWSDLADFAPVACRLRTAFQVE
jgi:predicted transcriptional regulator of viral defense system